MLQGKIAGVKEIQWLKAHGQPVRALHRNTMTGAVRRRCWRKAG
jgi:hypothetical protein